MDKCCNCTVNKCLKGYIGLLVGLFLGFLITLTNYPTKVQFNKGKVNYKYTGTVLAELDAGFYRAILP